ncbi:type VII secretion-associated serine protease mycosin [Streptomyces sp. TLI_235]|nr:S8 family serine peptidase [Streptomyces sp. TLI_235]PBC79585.1 type VII secretion-associated serine protease mycosin [Streptomyces sp. TLI_235]
MTLTRAMRVLGATTLAGALLLAAAPGASADQVRDGQWANQYFKLDKVWSVSKGDGVIVAVIDSGVDATHPDLTGQVLPGYDESGQNLNTKPTDAHGTGMAAEIAGHGHGGNAGVVGLAPGAKILPVYKGDAQGSDAIPQGVRWAVDHGAKVINISQGSTIENPEMPAAIAYAYQHDVLVVAAAGNGGAVDNPANLPGVLAVAAADKSGEVWTGSSSGPEIRLAAPGADIVTAGTCGSSQYCIGSGSSDAAAYVSAAAALVRAKYPQLTAGQVANRLAKSAAVPPSASGAKLPDPHFGYGVIRPYEALTMDIPAGSPEGPLAKPAGAAAPDAASNAPVSQPAGKSAVGGITPLMVFGGGAVLVVLLVIVIAVATRSRRQPQAAPVPPQGQAPYGAAPGWPPAQQPYGGQQPYGTQPPPPGYPQQQPYQNPYQGGNPPR